MNINKGHEYWEWDDYVQSIECMKNLIKLSKSNEVKFKHLVKLA